MTGMASSIGRSLSGVGHIQQSIANILNTPIGSRVMRREYGSLLPELIDRPFSDALMLQVYAATVMAITRWEPRVRIERFYRFIPTGTPGQAIVDMDVIRLDTGSSEVQRISIGLSTGGIA